MQDLKRHFDELKVCQGAFNDSRRLLLDQDKTPIRKKGNVMTSNLWARIRVEQAGPK